MRVPIHVKVEAVAYEQHCHQLSLQVLVQSSVHIQCLLHQVWFAPVLMASF